jgi:hypothetical protein
MPVSTKGLPSARAAMLYFETRPKVIFDYVPGN